MGNDTFKVYVGLLAKVRGADPADLLAEIEAKAAATGVTPDHYVRIDRQYRMSTPLNEHNSPSPTFIKAAYAAPATEYGMTSGASGVPGRLADMAEKNRDGDLISRRNIRGLIERAEGMGLSFKEENDGTVTFAFANANGAGVEARSGGYRLDEKALAYLREHAPVTPEPTQQRQPSQKIIIASVDPNEPPTGASMTTAFAKGHSHSPTQLG